MIKIIIYKVDCKINNKNDIIKTILDIFEKASWTNKKLSQNSLSKVSL